jgi:hypothetical protein
MHNKVSNDLLQALHSGVVDGLHHHLQQGSDTQSGRRLDPNVLIDKIAWSVLVPFFLAITTGLVLEDLKLRYHRWRNSENKTEEVKAFVGAEIKDQLTISKDELTELIHSEIKGLGISEAQASGLVEALLKQVGTNSSDSSKSTTATTNSLSDTNVSQRTR